MILYLPNLYSIDVISTNVRKCIQKLHIFFVRQVLFSIELIYIIYCFWFTGFIWKTVRGKFCCKYILFLKDFVV